MPGSSERDLPTGTRLALLALISNLLVLVLFVAVLEIMLLIMLRHPPPAIPILRVLSGFYAEHDRRIVQALPECAVYDPDLTYLLRPGQCRFYNRDFDTIKRVNSEGLRDDEASLAAPELIALGDSVTMGWGVDIEETFAKLIQGTCHLSVLNAGISSYATVRSLRLLHRLDTSNLRGILLQYSDNDFGENAHFYRNDNSLDIMSSEHFEAIQRAHVKSLRYFPGRYTFRFVPFVFSKTLSRLAGNGLSDPLDESHDRPRTRGELHAYYFLHALIHADHIPPGVPIFVFEINGRARNNHDFSNALRDLLDVTALPPHYGPVSVVHMADDLTNEKFFVLDDHINALGHQHVAQRLSESGLCTKLRSH